MRLADRSLGAQFCRFERELIFNNENRHIGFVNFTGRNTFELVKSKFTGLSGRDLYLLPEDLRRGVAQGEYVRVEPGGMERRYRPAPGRTRRSLRAPDFTDLTEVEGIHSEPLKIPPPNIPRDEFLARISRGWSNADSDLLDRVMGVLMLSAPPSVYGRGGIGSEGIVGSADFRSPGSGTPRNVAASIRNLLPTEFRNGNVGPYHYSQVGNLRDLKRITRGGEQEECFTLVKPHRVSDTWRGQSVPIQLPFVLRDSILLGATTEFDLDVLDYQLSAFYLPPPKMEDAERIAGEAVKRAMDIELFDMPGIGEIEPMGAVRLSMSLFRLSVGKMFTGKGYVRRTFLRFGEGQELFVELIRRGLDEVGKRKRTEGLIRGLRTHPWRDRLKDEDRMIYAELRRRYDELGIRDTPRSDLFPDRDQRMVGRSLERLNRFGYVLFMQGGAIVRVVVSEDPEEYE